jgi:hypothetical protein
MKPDSLQAKVFALLEDQNWHCRDCEGKSIASGQYAGGGGIQGLQRGTKTRDGLVIESENRFCTTCQKLTRHDRWTGETKAANATATFSKRLQTRILELLKYTDAIENRTRTAHELVIDHRFPMERWGGLESPNPADMSDAAIRAKFQLLKKDQAGNHNLLKSRACERCIATGQRGTPLGIRFWYQGEADWNLDIPKTGIAAEAGCVGCGWYDFAKWREALNQMLATVDQ